jgi:hypothetical protein
LKEIQVGFCATGGNSVMKVHNTYYIIKGMKKQQLFVEILMQDNIRLSCVNCQSGNVDGDHRVVKEFVQEFLRKKGLKNGG